VDVFHYRAGDIFLKSFSRIETWRQVRHAIRYNTPFLRRAEVNVIVFQDGRLASFLDHTNPLRVCLHTETFSERFRINHIQAAEISRVI
jgi:hypothetical protein